MKKKPLAIHDGNLQGETSKYSHNIRIDQRKDVGALFPAKLTAACLRRNEGRNNVSLTQKINPQV